ncbi:hypothetical protein TWF706_001360 [Orbilia oligospora]|nr:hypothetical protein TWF706_001360 [Orbilia oligospora]
MENLSHRFSKVQIFQPVLCHTNPQQGKSGPVQASSQQLELMLTLGENHRLLRSRSERQREKKKYLHFWVENFIYQTSIWANIEISKLSRFTAAEAEQRRWAVNPVSSL